MSKTEKLNKEQVFKQEVSDDELEAVAGGKGSGGECNRNQARDIYKGGFPNCAATVEEGSWCSSNDACITDAVRYWEMKNMVECNKAHR